MLASAASRCQGALTRESALSMLWPRMPQDISVPVARNFDLGHGNFLLDLDAPSLQEATEPGQFFMLGVPHADILLRRPFSVCGLAGSFEDLPPGRLRLLYKVVGAGTELLAALRPGAALHVLGPLGRGFSLPPAGARPVLVAGGIGSAPFPALTSLLARSGFTPRMLYGARSTRDLPLLDWFEARCQDVTVTTDDGSAGRRGFVTAALEDLLAREHEGLFLYACGPEPMLRAVSRLALEAGIACELSLEAHMACGFGVCLGCVVPTRGAAADDARFERVCVEGPVLRAERLAW